VAAAAAAQPVVVEEFLTMLISRGFSDSQAVMTYRAFSSFLLGHLLLEASLLGAQTSPSRNLWTKESPMFPTLTDRLSSTSTRISNGSRRNCPKIMPPRSSNERWKTCSAGSTGSSPHSSSPVEPPESPAGRASARPHRHARHI
jgi:hypothetical protein